MSQPKYYKKISNESGSFTADGNRNVSWSMHPDSMNDVDLSKSYLDLSMTVKDSQGTALNNETIQLADFDTEISYPSSAIVRNVRVVSDKVGVVEEIRESNRLSTSLYHYHSTDEMKAGRAESQTGEQIILSSGVGHLMVPVSDLQLGCAQKGVKLTEKHGECTLEVELEDSKDLFSLLNLSSTITWKNDAQLNEKTIVKTVTTSTTFDSETIAQNALRTGSKWSLGGTVFEVDTVALGTGGKAIITLAHPVYIGATINANSTATAVFSDIDYNLANVNTAGSKSTITIASNISDVSIAENTLSYAIYYNDTTNNQGYAFIRGLSNLTASGANTCVADLSTNITFSNAVVNGSLVRVYEDCDWEISKAELVYCKTNASGLNAQEIETYKTESMNVSNGVSEFRNQVLLPENPVMVVLAQETETRLCGDNNNVDKYRITVDGLDKTNRDVEYSGGQPKSHEVIINDVLKPKNLAQQDAWVMAEQLKEGDKMVDFTMKSNTSMEAARLHVFKKHLTTI